MNRIFAAIIILFFSQNLIAQDNDEFRATWVITWHLISSSAGVESNMARARNILDNHKNANMNAVLWQCRQGGTSLSWEPWIQKGIADGRLYSAGPGSYRFAENSVWGRHPSVLEITRTVPWVDGFQFFSYGSWEDYDYWTQAGATFFANKTKIRDTKLIVNTTPETPSVELTKVDSLNYLITVNPPALL